MTYRKKMIEVSIPLDAINAESSREKSIRHGHPSTIHLWWARRPLAACRAVIFCSLIDDPGEDGIPQRELELMDALPTPDPRPLEWDKMELVQQRRERLFGFIAKLVKWENSNDELIFGTARALIMAATDDNPPPVLDPFCGGGSIPLEAQRLGLKAYASDLNPVAVLITKALVEIPPKFANRPPVNPDSRKGTGGSATWKGAAGLADDVRYYGKWMRDQAWERIGHLYPNGPNGETVIAWLWARTVKCPNPACGGDMPLVRSFWLSTKKGQEAYVVPTVDTRTREVSFDVKLGSGSPREGTKVRRDIECIICDTSVTQKQLREQASRYGYGEQLMAVVTEGNRRRNYYSPEAISIPSVVKPDPSGLSAELPNNPRWFSPPAYGLTTYADLFTPRQLVALTAFSDLVREASELARQHAIEAGIPEDGSGIAEGGTGAQAYSDALATYLAFAVNRVAATDNSLARWNPVGSKVQHAFGRQALPMIWDFADANPFGGSTGDFGNAVEYCAGPLSLLGNSGNVGSVEQLDAAQSLLPVSNVMVVTDPPYYDNVGYADLSDFFYVWLRRCLNDVYPSLFSTLLTPKTQELVATPYRFNGDRKKAEHHFEVGLGSAFTNVRTIASMTSPTTVYYAYKQTEGHEAGARGRVVPTSTGWETFLESLRTSHYEITATWPLRTEMRTRQVAMGTNALASSIVLACRPRSDDAPIATLREFNATLSSDLSPALNAMITGHIAPVDLAQSVIGPGMAVFSRYAKVVEPDGSDMTVRRALELINNAVETYMAEREGSMDRDTQFCLHWFEEHGFHEGPYGQAEVLARAKDVGVEALARGGVLKSGQGKVQLIDPDSYVRRVEDYDPTQDTRISTWEACHYLAAAIAPPHGSEEMAGRLARRLGGLANDARDLAYRLYAICEQKGWSAEGQAYNLLADSWPAIQAAAANYGEETQGGLGLR